MISLSVQHLRPELDVALGILQGNVKVRGRGRCTP
jgi:hypothetical protein